MSDPENFLSRWSRRKLEPSDAPSADTPETKAGEAGDAPQEPVKPVEAQQAETKEEPAFDLVRADARTAPRLQGTYAVPGAAFAAVLSRKRKAYASPSIYLMVQANTYALTRTASLKVCTCPCRPWPAMREQARLADFPWPSNSFKADALTHAA